MLFGWRWENLDRTIIKFNEMVGLVGQFEILLFSPEALKGHQIKLQTASGLNKFEIDIEHCKAHYVFLAPYERKSENAVCSVVYCTMASGLSIGGLWQRR